MEKLTLKEFLKFNKEDLKGKIICFPTDTVYGVGTLFGDQMGINKIYAMKKRDYGKPLVNLCSSIKQIADLNITIDIKARALMEKYWPGALTIVLCHQNETISFRMPDSIISLSLLEHFSLIATTSVNESGEPELNTLEEIEKRFKDHIDFFITDFATFSKVPSTVVKVCENEISVLRQGQIDVFQNK
ncbi:MAG: L-threonylcarbamoyladenylate synthase [Bacilli bacterium]